MVTQEEISERLKHVFGENNVISEWDVAKHSHDNLTRLYCPRIDIVVSPFNIDGDLERNNRSIWDVYEANRNLIEAIKRRSDVPNRGLELNDNPRCFIAIELENNTRPKQRIGSIINASAMGKVGIVATNTKDDFDRIVKIREYLEFLQSVGKSKYNPQNIMVVLAEDLFEVLNQATR